MMEPVDELRKAVLKFLYVQEQETIYKKQREDLRDYLKAVIMEGEQDEHGNYNLEFESPVSPTPTDSYRGLQAQRRVSEFIDTDTAFQVIDEAGLWDRCVKEEVVFEIDF